MDRRIRRGAPTIAALLGATAITTALLNGAADDTVFPTPRAEAAALTNFAGCTELRQWYVDQALPDVGPWGLGGGPIMYGGFGPADGVTAIPRGATADQGALTSSRDASLDSSVSNSETGTNVQEAGVDEPDRAKTADGVLVHLSDVVESGAIDLVVTDVSGATPQEQGRLRLPADLGSAQLLLSGDTVLVIADGPGYPGAFPHAATLDGNLDRDLGRGTDQPLDGRPFLPVPPAPESSRLLQVSLSDPTAPAIVSDQTFSAGLLSARQYGDTVRLVLSTERPTLDFVYPDRKRSIQDAAATNRRIVRNSTLSDWLPSVERDGTDRLLLDCADVAYPEDGGGYRTTTVVTLPASDPEQTTTTAVTAAAGTVYSSLDRLYLSTVGQVATSVHAFALDGPDTTYVASGEVDGWVTDRWSMDEHDGLLRVAVAHGAGWNPSDNGITVLEEVGADLKTIGSVRDLGPKEQIRSVRWFDDLAIVVTFRQIDPLYTVDLSDPTAPRTLGELKIPGFSDYLHPVGDDRLLGLGQDADLDGTVRGGQLSSFNLADLAAPERTDTLDLGKHGLPSTASEPRSFTWLPDSSTALFEVYDQRDGVTRMHTVSVADDGTLTAGPTWVLDGGRAGRPGAGRALPLDEGRVAIVGTEIRLVQVG